ncbi:MAG: cytochrome c [Xanthomonadales bacterium]|nr:cytochrome c [Xanthomonadales bacterium]
MRTAVALVLGLAVGFAVALIAARAMSAFGAHPKATMVIMARHMDALRAANGADDCDDQVVASRLGQLQAMAREIDFAFASAASRQDGFERRARRFASVSAAQVDSSVGCRDVGPALAALGKACQDCHRDFR